MKKILRMALVLALAGSALLYTSCTKDYSPDISSLQDQINAIQSNTDGLPWVKDQLQQLQATLNGLAPKVTIGDDELNNRINGVKGDLTSAVSTINAALDGKADKGTVNSALADLNTAISDLQSALEARLDALDGDEGRVAAIEETLEALGAASAAIDSQFGEYAKFIQSMAYVPSSTFGYESAYPFTLTDGQTVSDTLLVLSFMVTPPEAASRVTMETAKMVAVATKAAAAAPVELTIKKLVYREDAPGYVDVYAIVKGLKTQSYFGASTFAVALEAEQTVGEGDDALIESVTSDYANVYGTGAQDLLFQIYDAEEGDVIPEFGYRDDHEVRVSPSSPSDSVKVFTEGRWSVVADVAGAYMSPAEAKDFFGVSDIKLVSPAAGDTLYDDDYDSDYYASEDKAFETTVHPKRPKTVVDCIVDGEDYAYVGIAIKNSHAGGPQSGWAYGVYHAVPDTVALTLTPQDVHEGPIDVIIPWDYKYYDNIKDTLIAKIHVDGDRDRLVGADATETWNADSETDYTEGLGDVKEHSNDKNAIDAVLVSAAEYGKVDSTYVYSIQKFDQTNATEYVGEFEYIVKARPADAVIELGPIDTMVCYSSPTNIVVDAITAAYDYHKEYYKPYTLDEVAADALTMGVQKGVEVTIDGKKADASLVTGGDFGYANGEETTNFDINLNKPGEWKVTVKTEFANIAYTFVVTINVEGNPARIAPKSAYVTVDDAETKDYSVEVKGDVDESTYHYYLVHQPFQDYLKVVEYAETSEELKMDLKNITKMPADTAVKEPTTPCGLVRLVEDKTVANLADKMTFEWDKWDSLAFYVAARLIPAVQPDATVDSATVRLWTKDPIPVFDGGNGIVVEHEKDSLAHTNIIAGINIADLNGIKLNDKDGLRAIGPDAETGEIVVDYDQEIEIGNVELVSGADFIEELNIYFDPNDTNVLCLDLNQGVIVDPIVVKIPITLSYMLDRGLEAKNTIWVTVTFIEKGKAAPAPVEP